MSACCLEIRFFNVRLLRQKSVCHFLRQTLQSLSDTASVNMYIWAVAVYAALK